MFILKFIEVYHGLIVDYIIILIDSQTYTYLYLDGQTNGTYLISLYDNKLLYLKMGGKCPPKKKEDGTKCPRFVYKTLGYIIVLSTQRD